MHTMTAFNGALLLATLLTCSAAAADVVISSDATQNMSCAGSICAPTATKAVLNVTDLENLVAQDGNVTVTTTGENVEATNIAVTAKLATPDATSLTLQALGAIRVGATVSIGSDFAELQLQSGTAGTLGDIAFGPRGHITFGSTSDVFNINGGVFQLVATLPQLVQEANAQGSGFYALTNDYDAGADGTYNSAPVGITFTGYFEALGNTISNLNIAVTQGNGEYIGLFAHLDGNAGFGVVRNLRLAGASVQSNYATDIGAIAGYVELNGMVAQSSSTGTVSAGDSSSAGGIAGFVNAGSLVSCWSSADVTAGNTFATLGGLVGASAGAIGNSHATGKVTGGQFSSSGGLAGLSNSAISESFATGNVQTNGGGATAGGLVGENVGRITNSYARAAVSGAAGGGGANSLGGLVGYDEAGAAASYATGRVTGGGSDLIGGLAGVDCSHGGMDCYRKGRYRRSYWDTRTSGISQGAGNVQNDSGMTGLTSKQFRTGLPDGFDRKIWKEKADVNNGFPYLIANRP